jgi:hypothetical protein
MDHIVLPNKGTPFFRVVLGTIGAHRTISFVILCCKEQLT